jgi:lysozyme family protein
MADPRIALAITLDANHEGGYQDEHNDRANWSSGQIGVGTLVGTKYGITAVDMPGVDIKNLTLEAAENWYLTTTKPQHFNNPLYAQIESQVVHNKLFDMGVLFGVGTAVAVLQLTLGLKQDCVFGPVTLAAVNATSPDSLLDKYKTNMVTHAFNVAAKNPEERGNLPGWSRRINS